MWNLTFLCETLFCSSLVRPINKTVIQPTILYYLHIERLLLIESVSKIKKYTHKTDEMRYFHLGNKEIGIFIKKEKYSLDNCIICHIFLSLLLQDKMSCDFFLIINIEFCKQNYLLNKLMISSYNWFAY